MPPLPTVCRRICAVFFLLAFVRCVRADTYDTMRAKWLDYLTYSNNFNASDPDIAAGVAAISSAAASTWNDRVTGTFTDRVKEDFLSGVRSGVNGTPTFFINGTRHDDSWDEETLLAALKEAA